MVETTSLLCAKNERQRSVNGASTERQRLLALHLGKFKACAASLRHNRTIGRLLSQNSLRQDRNHVTK